MNLSNLAITQELLKIIAELDAFNASWEVKSHHNPEYLTHLRHVVNGGAFPPKDGEYTFLKNKAA